MSDVQELTALEGRLAEKIAKAEQELTSTNEQAAALTIDVESGDRAKLRDLSAAEKKAGQIGDELGRLRMAYVEVQRRIDDAKQAAEQAHIRKLAEEYIACQDSVQ